MAQTDFILNKPPVVTVLVLFHKNELNDCRFDIFRFYGTRSRDTPIITIHSLHNRKNNASEYHGVTHTCECFEGDYTSCLLHGWPSWYLITIFLCCLRSVKCHRDLGDLLLEVSMDGRRNQY